MQANGTNEKIQGDRYMSYEGTGRPYLENIILVYFVVQDILYVKSCFLKLLMCSNQNFLLQNMRSHELASLITIRVACLLIGELTCYYTNQMCNCGAAMDVKNRKHE